jgi:hypothetical protein
MVRLLVLYLFWEERVDKKSDQMADLPWKDEK